MSLDTDAIIDLVAKEHGIFLSKNDPLLSLLAVNDIILAQHSNHLTVQVKDLKEHLESITDQYQCQSKEIANVIVGQTVQKIQCAGNNIQNNLEKIMLEQSLKYKQEIEILLSASQRARNQSYYAGLFSGVGALITILSVIFLLVFTPIF